MTNDEKHRCSDRAQNILDVLRYCNSGTDVHEVANMRHVAYSIQDLCQGHTKLTYKDIDAILKRLETNCAQYFKNKYAHL